MRMKKLQWNSPSREGLKLLAACIMLLDHMGLALFPGDLWLRCVGRLAFPIYAFFLAEGFCYTSSKKRYFLRLVLFALLAEAPFDRMTQGLWISWSGQNVLWTLALSLLAMACVRWARTELNWRHIAGLLGAAGCCVLAELGQTDYGAFGVLLCLLFFCTRDQRGRFWLCGILFLVMCYAFGFVPLPGTPVPLEAFGVLSFPLLALYRGRSRKLLAFRYLDYWFYPVHMLLLSLLA